VCMGDSVVLNAGPGFQQYQWSNGASAQKLTVFASNSYSVTGTTNDGCKSGDTIRIVVNNNPDVELGNDNTSAPVVRAYCRPATLPVMYGRTEIPVLPLR